MPPPEPPEPIDESEEREIEELGAPRPVVVFEVVRREGEQELERPALALAWSGLAAGLSMGFSFLTQGLLRAALPDEPWRPLVTSLGYCVGFLIVVLGRQQLFAENTLTSVLPLLHRPSWSRLRQVLRLWGVVLAANLTGALAFAFVIARSEVVHAEVRDALAMLAQEALVKSFAHVLLDAIFAGWLIALMVWILPAAETARPTVIIVITYVLGIAAFSHVIAGSTEVLYLAAAGGASWSHVVGGWILPALLGNAFGGVALVSVINYGQVAAGHD